MMWLWFGVGYAVVASAVLAAWHNYIQKGKRMEVGELEEGITASGMTTKEVLETVVDDVYGGETLMMHEPHDREDGTKCDGASVRMLTIGFTTGDKKNYQFLLDDIMIDGLIRGVVEYRYPNGLGSEDA